jgi:outer membrane protein insertion porin family
LRWFAGPAKAGHYLLFLLCFVRPAEAAVTDYVGRPIVEVHVRSNGVELSDPSVLQVIVTRTGAPLRMIEVRETMAHLFGLGRYQDVQVDASLRGDGVLLSYHLVPALRIRRIVFEGSLALPEDELRRTVVDRYSASPSLSRASQAVATLQTLYRDHGYPQAQIATRIETARDPATASLVFTIQPGMRARIGTIDVQGSPRETPSEFLNRIEVQPGDEYDGIALDVRLARYAEDLRQQGYYEARVAQLPRYVDQDRVVNLVLSIEPGHYVEIVFEGDALSARERSDLVPIAREHSVDEDLLEDAKFAIERHLRNQGFCNPRADYERTTAAAVLRITFTVARGPRCVLERAEVTGNVSISSEELNPLIQMKAGAPFIEATVGSDAARIQGLYRQRGFSAVKVSPQIETANGQAAVASVRVRLAIAEGARSLIRSVTFEGNTDTDPETLRQSIKTAPGQPYFEPQIAADADKLALLYLNRGYQAITVQPDPRLAPDGASVDLRFVIHEGPQILIDHVLIVGNVRTRTETIAREVQLKSGQPLSQDQEDETRKRITELGLFRRVDISYLQLPGDETHRDVVITVEEAPATTIGYGGGLEGGKRTARSRETGLAVEEFQVAPRGFFEVTRRNLFGKDRLVNLFTRVSFRPEDTTADSPTEPADTGGYGFNEYLARLTYSERRLWNTNADASISAGIEQAVRSSFSFNRRGASATIARRISRTLALSGRYAIDYTRLLNIKPTFAARPEIDRLFPQVRLSSVSSALIRDTRNDPLEPNTGSLIGLDTELAARNIGSEVGFVKTFLQGFNYRQVGRLVAVFGGRLGLATGFPRLVTAPGQTESTVVDDLPASKRFYAGGDTTVRGFATERLGTATTIDPAGFPKGGHGLVVLNAEIRAPLRGGLGVVGFLDAGNVFQHVDDMDLGDLRTAAGFGLRYRSPVGPIRVDLGFKLDRKILPNGQRERPTALHISLGQAF